MSHSETIGERPAGGGPDRLGARLARLFSPVRSTGDPLEETVEFTPEGVEPPVDVGEGPLPRFATVWLGYGPGPADPFRGAAACAGGGEGGGGPSRRRGRGRPRPGAPARARKAGAPPPNPPAPPAEEEA